MKTRTRSPRKTLTSAVRLMACAAFAVSFVAITPVLAGEAYGEGCEAALAQDYETAYKKWEPLVARNDGCAQFQLALMYHAGLHVEQSEAKAVELYHMAAHNGVEEAREFLIAGYQHGWFGLSKNESLAAHWQARTLPG